jgi:tetratricopeptide (TPR) repeat protein
VMSEGYSLWNGIVRIAGIAGGEGKNSSGWFYTLSARHFRDFFNNQYLLGPVAALVLVPLCVLAWRRRLYTVPLALFLSVAALTMLAGSWATAELQLGYPRDWDLFAPAAVMYSAAVLYLLLKMVPAGFVAERVLVFALVVSVVNVVPWVWINHSEMRSLERFKTLPLGFGRTELVVANWYRDRGRHAEAKLWFEKSLRAEPNNVDANSYVGLYHADAGEYELARPYFERAVVLRPDKRVFRTNYANVLLELNRFDEAVPHLVWLAKRYPGNLDYWLQVGDRISKAGNLEALSEVYEPVFARLEQKLAENPRDDVALINKGLLLARLGRLEESVTCYNRALDIDPNSASALFNEAVALDDLEREGEARDMYRRFLRIRPDHPMAGYAKSRLENISGD